MKTIFFSCSESCSLDIQTGRLSLFHIFEEIHAAGFPTFVQSLALTLNLERESNEPSEITVTFRFSIGGQVINNIPAPLNFQHRSKARSVSVIQGILVPQPGQLVIEAIYNDQHLSSWVIDANLLEGAQQVLPFGQVDNPAPQSTKRKARKNTPAPSVEKV